MRGTEPELPPRRRSGKGSSKNEKAVIPGPLPDPAFRPSAHGRPGTGGQQRGLGVLCLQRLH